MGDDAGVARLRRHGDGVEGLREGADLIELDEDGVGHLLIDAPGQNLRVGHEEVIAHQLDPIPQAPRQGRPARPVALVHAVFNGDDGVTLAKRREILRKAFRIEALPFPRKMVNAVLVELARRAIEGQRDVLSKAKARLRHGLRNHLEGGFVAGQVRRKAPLIPHGGGQAPGLQHGF